MSNDTLWNTDQPVTDFDIEVPRWIEQDITPCDVASIVHGGCDSGAYMPAVTYHQALDTMHEHGDDVLQYIEDTLGELPTIPEGTSWSGIAVFYLSVAVELWASSVEDELTSAIEDAAQDEESEA